MNMTREFHAEDLEKVKRFMGQIDWEPFKTFLKENYDIEEEISTNLKIVHNIVYPKIVVEKDLRDIAGIFKHVLYCLHLQNFSAGIYRPVVSYDQKKYDDFFRAHNYSFFDEDIDLVLGPATLWANMNLSYTDLNGGHNGMTLFSCEYTENKGWSFRKAGE